MLEPMVWRLIRNVPIAVLVVVMGAVGWVARAQEDPERVWRPNHVPQIELRAPGLFDRFGETPRAEHTGRYRVNATVLVPVFSIPLAHRDDVGFASAAAQEFSAGPGHDIRTYELFSASFPERARGLNRMGFIREAVKIGRDGAEWTAHFGALSSNPEVSRREVALDSDETRQSYTVMDGFTDRFHSANTDTRLELDGSWTSAGFFYKTLIPVWHSTRPADQTRTRPHTQVVYMEPLGFLGIVQRSLAVAAADSQRHSAPRLIRYPFAHKGALMYLALTDHRVDSKRQQHYAAEGLVEPDAVVHRLDYRILDSRGGLVKRFRLWTQLPPSTAPRQTGPVFPVEFEFKAKSFLQLHVVRVASSLPAED